jgi:hypothetical protein
LHLDLNPSHHQGVSIMELVLGVVIFGIVATGLESMFKGPSEDDKTPEEELAAAIQKYKQATKS